MAARGRAGWRGAVAPALAVSALAVLALATPARAGPPGVFEIPAIATVERAALARALSGDRAGALALLDRQIAETPEVGSLLATRGLLLALAGDTGGALDDLEEAARLGHRDFGTLASLPPHHPLRADPRLAVLLDRAAASAAPPPPWEAPRRPAAVANARAPVGEANTRWDPAHGMLEAHLAFPPVLARRPVFGGETGPAARAVQDGVNRGLAAGLAGDLYDNRDRGHSTLSPARYPQLSFTVYDGPARAAGIDYGLNETILFPGTIAFGNSSTAITAGPRWRSQARMALTNGTGAAALVRQWEGNALYVYPEHRDHDPPGTEEGGQPGQGDLFPALTPYMLVSQGSSGSDRPLLDAVAHILAALPPGTKAFLKERGLVAPTVQMVFRRGLSGVDDDREAYLGPAAHPTAVPASRIDLARMVAIANRLEPGTVPPAVRLRVVEDFTAGGRVALLGDGLGEALLDTPAAVARIWRSLEPRRRIVLDAGGTEDPNGRPLRFHWRLLRGDPGAVRIATSGEGEARAEIRLGWHERREVPVTGPGGATALLPTDRVDIAVFADNGAELSAPAFLSVVFPARQARLHAETPAGPRLVSVDYADTALVGRYEDPLLFPERRWSDAYLYDDEGRLLGWTRTDAAGTRRFTRHGFLVREADGAGRPVVAEVVAYPVAPGGSDGRALVRETPTGRLMRYRYAGPGDRLGIPAPEPTSER